MSATYYTNVMTHTERKRDREREGEGEKLKSRVEKWLKAVA